MPLIGEVWRDVVGYEGLYRVSDLGRVKSLERLVFSFSRQGSPYRLRVRSKDIRQRKAGMGYLVVDLHKDGVCTTRYVHRLVLEAFVGPCPDGLECRHFPDGDKCNNDLANLSWGSHAQNESDKLVHGTKLGRPVSAETRAKIGSANKGKKRTAGVRAKMSAAQYRRQARERGEM